MYTPSEVDKAIAAKFYNRCVRCKKPWKTIHEIETRGAIGKAAMVEDNRVPLCGACHRFSHRVGTLNSSIILLSYRDKVLANDKKAKRSRRK